MLKLAIKQEKDVGDHSWEVCSMCKNTLSFPFAKRLIGSFYDLFFEKFAGLGRFLELIA
jgi:hypothetical protein